MDFKSLLSQLDQLNEAENRKVKGKSYGGSNQADTSSDEDETPKKKRGGQAKDDGPKFDLPKGDIFGRKSEAPKGKKGRQVTPMKDADKAEKKAEKAEKKGLKEYFDSLDKALNEAALTPTQTLVPGFQAGGKAAEPTVIDIKNNPALKAALDKAAKDKQLTTVSIPQQGGQTTPGQTKQTSGAMGADNQQSMEEDAEDYSAKKARAGQDIGKPGKNFSKIAASAGKKYGSKEAGKRVAGAILAKLRGKVNEADLPVHDGDMGAGLGAGRSQATFEGKKPDFTDVDKDGNKKESWTKAEKDKKKKTVKEGMDTRIKAAHHAGKSHALSKQNYSCKYDDVEEARAYHDGFKEGLDECYGQVPIAGIGIMGEAPSSTVDDMASYGAHTEELTDEGNAFTGALNRTPTGGKFSVGGKTFTDRSSIEEEGVFESWDNQLNSLLEEYGTIQEGMTVSISKGQEGAPDSVSVSAQDAEADQLLSIIKQAGLGLFGGDEQSIQPMGHEGGDEMSVDVGEPAEIGAGGDDIDVVDDHEGMMALIKKVTGDAGQPNVVAIGGAEGGEDGESGDYESEEGSEEHSEEYCDACDSADCHCDDSDDSDASEEGESDEEDKEDDSEKEKVDEVESEDQMTYEVAEDNAPDSGAAEEEEEIQDTQQANNAAAEYDAAEEEQGLNEWANDAGQMGTDEAFEADIDFMVNAISGGLNKRKVTGQTTIPVVASQLNRTVSHGTTDVNESISDWKALAGIK